MSHPFRLDARGRIASVDQNSDTGTAEQLAILALTHTGERPLVPGFGIPDPAFAGFDDHVYAAAVGQWGPPVQLTDVRARVVDDSTQAVTVSFD